MSTSALNLDRIQAETFVARVEHHVSLGSTNDRAKELAASDTGALPLLIVADQQTAGRGRGGNRWWTGRGGLAFTLLVEGQSLGDERLSQPLVALATAVAIVEAVTPLLQPDDAKRDARPPHRAGFRRARATGRLEKSSYAEGHVGLHWPNDVYVGDRKLAGILVEVLPDRKHVIGIGLNANNSLADAPPELQQTATTLLDRTGRPHDPTEILTGLLKQLARAPMRNWPSTPPPSAAVPTNCACSAAAP